MFINAFDRLYFPEIISAFSGALLYTLVQNTFRGPSKLLIFLVSFFMGIVGTDSTISLISHYLPVDAILGREIGAFICSLLIVTVAMKTVANIEKYMPSKNQL